jgi:hypothetical protein
VPVDENVQARLLDIATNATTKIREAVAAERVVQLQARADVITAITEQHRSTTASLEGQLADARAEVKDREDRIRVLLGERHDDVGKLGTLHERAVTAEHRDAQIAAKSQEDERRVQLEAIKAKLNNDLMRDGLKFFGDKTTQILPLVLPAAATNGAAKGSKVVDTIIGEPGAAAAPSLQEEPPPLCFAIAQLMWRVRDPDLVGLLAIALSQVALLPGLQGLGAKLSQEAPDAFAVVAALVRAEAAKASISVPSTPLAGTPPSASTNGTPTNGTANGAAH